MSACIHDHSYYIHEYWHIRCIDFKSTQSKNNSCCLLIGGCLTSKQHAGVSHIRSTKLKQKLQIKVSISSSYSILTRGQPVSALTLYCRAPGSVATYLLYFCLPLIPLGASREERDILSAAHQNAWAGGMLYRDSVSDSINPGLPETPSCFAATESCVTWSTNS